MEQAQHVEEHFNRLARLLDLESKAEARQLLERAKRLAPEEAERTGTTLVDMVVVDEEAGLGGRVVLTLNKGKRLPPLPWTRLDVGSPVMMSAGRTSKAMLLRGVVSERGERQIRVAVNQWPDEAELHSNWRLDLAHDEVGARRARAAMEVARGAHRDRLSELREVLLGAQNPRFKPIEPVAILNAGLNEVQREAVAFALSARDVALVHGPPGTGKTTAVVEVIRQAVRRGEKVLACAPSNIGVDNLLERLVGFKERVVRIGHPARVLPQLRSHTLDLMVEAHDDVRAARKLVNEAFRLRTKAAKRTTSGKRELWRESKDLLHDARRMEDQAVESILNQASVVCATLTGLDSEILGDRRFQLAVLDEACQSTEPSCWIPLLRCDRLVLAGDHRQLPPTVVSREAAAQGFDVSLFERVVHRFGAGVTRRLTMQYRMHRRIMDFSSREFYEGQLIPAPEVEWHLLRDLPGLRDEPLTAEPVEFIDTAGAGFDEEKEPDGDSRQNPREAAVIVRKVQALTAAGLSPRQIAVIAPYAAQARLLRGMLKIEGLEIEGLEIDTVDGFQGREKEAVLITLVRSNLHGEIGFLSDVRRMNVALTRARRKLVVVGDSATLGSHPFFQSLLEYFEAIGAYRTVWEEPDFDLPIFESSADGDQAGNSM